MKDYLVLRYHLAGLAVFDDKCFGTRMMLPQCCSRLSIDESVMA